jgi:hypothetical protein
LKPSTKVSKKAGKKAGKWYSYFGAGLGLFVGRVVALASYISTIYYLAIVSTPWLKAIFPTFPIFVVVGVAIGGPITIIFGYIWFKTEFFVQDSLNNLENNPLWVAFFEYAHRDSKEKGWTDISDTIEEYFPEFKDGEKKG